MFKEVVRRIREDFSRKKNWPIIWHRVKCFVAIVGIIGGIIFFNACLLTLLPNWPFIMVPIGVVLFVSSIAGCIYLMIKIIEVSVDQEDDILYPHRKDY